MAMFDLSTLAALVGASVALALLPGPSSMLVLSRSISQGRRFGIVTALGNFVGIVGVVLAAALGLAALLEASVVAFTAVKLVGAGYLFYLGLRMLLDRSGNLHLPSAPKTSLRQAFWQGVLTDLLNPKTVIFFTAFLPQFIHPERGGTTLQFMVMGLISGLVLVSWVLVIAFASSSVRASLLRYPGFVKWQSRVVGTVFIAPGVRLALARRE